MTDRLGALQDTLYASRNPTRRWLHGARRAWVEAAVGEAAVPSTRRALEVGPGSGVYLPTLLARFGEVLALDREPSFLGRVGALAARHPSLAAVAGDAGRLPFGAGRFDLALCSEVLEHLPRPDDALTELRRVLRPGGALVLTTPHRWSTLEVAARVGTAPGLVAVARLVYGEPVEPLGHQSLMTRGRLEAALARAGFLILRRHACGLYLPGVAEFGGERGLRLARRLEGRLRGRGRWEELLWTQAYLCAAP